LPEASKDTITSVRIHSPPIDVEKWRSQLGEQHFFNLLSFIERIRSGNLPIAHSGTRSVIPNSGKKSKKGWVLNCKEQAGRDREFF
jgi:hypothetical protein